MDMLEALEKLAHLRVSVRFLAKLGGRPPLPSVPSVPSRSFWLVLPLHDCSLVSWFIVVCPCRGPGLNCVGRSLQKTNLTSILHLRRDVPQVTLSHD